MKLYAGQTVGQVYSGVSVFLVQVPSEDVPNGHYALVLAPGLVVRFAVRHGQGGAITRPGYASDGKHVLQVQSDVVGRILGLLLDLHLLW